MTTETVRPAATAALPLRTPESVLFQLLTDLDAAPDDASALRLTLNAIIAVVPCEQAFLHVRDERTDAPQLQRSAATDRAFFGDYATHFRVMDPFASEAVQQRCIRENRSLASEDILAPEAMRQTPFHTQFLARHGNLAHGLCRHATLGKHQHTDLRLFRRADQAPFSWQERELVDLFHNQIAPPLRLRHELASVRRERDALRAGIDLMNHAVFLLNANARVITCNRAAKALTREGRQLRLVDEQLLPGHLMDHASWIPAALARLRHPTSRSHLEALPGRRKGPPRHYGILSLVDERHSGSDAAALLTLMDVQQPAPRHTLDELRRTFDFTAAEARIADAMVAGMGTEQISTAFLIRRDTVRSHIKRLLSKTGTHGHVELQKLLLRISPNFTTLQQKSVTSASQ